MAGEAYHAQVIVLRKTKLGESDLILTLLGQDGSQLRAVAKGARKPANTFASRLELYSMAEVLCAKGRSLDIVKEARLVDPHRKLRIALEYSAGAAPMAELLDKATQDGLANQKLFAMTAAALSCLEEVDVGQIPSITAAHLLKAFAFLGLRPSLGSCAVCAAPLVCNEHVSQVPFSYREGGALCPQCSALVVTPVLSSAVMTWLSFLLGTPFAEIKEKAIMPEVSFEALRFCQAWAREHLGLNMRSLAFMLGCGLYGSGSG
ncbi:MAG: DNA repair protein RecO [Coriobacteriaceae bacterium]|jgi:DNA repair protein RecO (recombination protein O)|nr:DNA repair protein RecO [Coriobacteriaceae bacterium]